MLITGLSDYGYMSNMQYPPRAGFPSYANTPAAANNPAAQPVYQNAVPQNQQPNRYPAGGMQNPAVVMWNSDGDSAELSRPFASAMPRSAFPNPIGPQSAYPGGPVPVPQGVIPGAPVAPPPQGAFPGAPIVPQGGATPSATGAEKGPKLIPEAPGSGLLDSLKPEGECQTCASRKYVDGSDDPSVSYQTPTNISPNMAAAAVAAHEQEHVRNEQANAQREGKQVVRQSVTLHYDTCPECGKSYVAGGTTRTTTAAKAESPLAEMEAQQAGQAQGQQPESDSEEE